VEISGGKVFLLRSFQTIQYPATQLDNYQPFTGILFIGTCLVKVVLCMVNLGKATLNKIAMKKVLIFIAVVVVWFIACKKDDPTTIIKPVQLDQRFHLGIKESAELITDGIRITFLGITEDSRCPTNVNCIWEGRVVAEFKVKKGEETLIKSLTNNPGNDPSLGTSFNAFGRSVKLHDVSPYPDGSPIADKDYRVSISFGMPSEIKE